jgi:S-adenosylmethionine-diacylglycerol 3-amino-3-carboxypropyl transferase
MLKKALNKLRDKLFSRIHSNYLIYNTCWEDPRIDRELLHIRPDSEVVMITSAGCNALDYLLDHPAVIHSIDMNPRQNSLLELKQAVIAETDHPTLFQLFGQGQHPDFAQVLGRISKRLSAYALEFWTQKANYFQGGKSRKTFYFYGTSGTFAYIFTKYLRSRRIMPLFDQLFAVQRLEEQPPIYAKIEKKVMNKFVLWVMNRQITLSLLGVPRPQRQLIKTTYTGGLSKYISDNLRHIFAELPIHENYFWHVYLKGYYTPTCCPNYLKAEHFADLRHHIDRIKTHTKTISQFLIDNPGKYSHYILLDHQDWLASYAPELLEEEWRLILANSKPGTKILLRSASLNVDFFPDFVLKQVSFETEKSQVLHRTDRVGTYASMYIMTVK